MEEKEKEEKKNTTRKNTDMFFGGCFKQTCNSDISVDFPFLCRRVIAYMEKFGFISVGCEF